MSDEHSFRPPLWLWFAGCGMLILGLLHLPIAYAFEGEQLRSTWSGPISWRKPILFGISTGLTSLSLGWILARLQEKSRDVWLAPVVAVSFGIEVGLITAQQWRGVESHFNHSNVANTMIDGVITLLVIVAFGYIIDLTIRSFKFFAGSEDLKLAVRSGMVFLVVSCLLGLFIVVYGNIQKSTGNSPVEFGKSGVLKFPHGMAIHAIQALPICCWAMSHLNVSVALRTRVIRLLTASVGALLLFSLVQTFSGRSRFDISLGGGFWLAAAGLSALIAIAAVLNSLFSVRAAD